MPYAYIRVIYIALSITCRMTKHVPDGSDMEQALPPGGFGVVFCAIFSHLSNLSLQINDIKHQKAMLVSLIFHNNNTNKVCA